MSAELGSVPFISAGVANGVFHPLRCVAELTNGNKEISKADTLKHRKKKKKEWFMDLILNQGEGCFDH